MAEVSMFLGYARIVDKVKKAGATSPETAKTAKEIGVRESTLKLLKQQIKETSDGRFYVEGKPKTQTSAL